MIVTVTLNPSLNVRYDAPGVELGAANQVSRVRYAAGGRGLAVARLLQMFGHEVVAAGLVGGAAGAFIRNELTRAGVPTQFTAIGAESQRVTWIRDGRTAVATSFEEPSPFITTEELGRLAADYRGLLDGATAVVLAGDLPDGLPDEIFGSLASYAADAGVPVVLNAEGSALRHGTARRPALVIPESAADAAGIVAARETSVVLASEHEVRALTTDGGWRAELAAADAASSRDALVAGFIPGVALGWSWPDMLRHALALAASTVDGEPDLAAYERLLAAVTVTSCSTAGHES